MIAREAVLEALRAEDVAAHYDIKGSWRGRWMRSKRCPIADHTTDAFGLARDGMWHCWSCDIGGDLLKLIATAEKIDIRADFPKVLTVAAGIAGVEDEDDFGGPSKPPKPARPAPPPVPPIAERLSAAKKRALWLWSKLGKLDRVGSAYLRDRGIVLVNDASDDIRSTPLLGVPADALAKSEELQRLHRMMVPFGVAVPVRSPKDGAMVDVRVRRIEPREGQPKIIGMLGGVVREGADLHGCYGRPHDITSDVVIVCEGMFDFLSASAIYPHANVLGATDAGSLPLVARHAAMAVAANGIGTVVIVCQRDEATTDEEYKLATKNGAGDRACDEATKNVISILGSRGVAWIECGAQGYKDLNEMHVAMAKPQINTVPLPLVEEDFG